jgi:hypothetical protein
VPKEQGALKNKLEGGKYNLQNQLFRFGEVAGMSRIPYFEPKGRNCAHII